MGQRISQKSFY